MTASRVLPIVLNGGFSAFFFKDAKKLMALSWRDGIVTALKGLDRKIGVDIFEV